MQRWRSLVNEQIVGRIGEAMGAPVGHVELVNVPAELVSIEPGLQHIMPGFCHGCRFLGDNMGRRSIENTQLPENRPRFSRLCVLYGWAGSADDQFLYCAPIPLVYSVDHGHFFGIGNPNWEIDQLRTRGTAEPDQQLRSACSLTDDELRAAAAPLRTITDPMIRDIVTIPPDEWGINAEERDALTNYLMRRRDDLLAACGA
jgi:hypothetical protein